MSPLRENQSVMFVVFLHHSPRGMEQPDADEQEAVAARDPRRAPAGRVPREAEQDEGGQDVCLRHHHLLGLLAAIPGILCLLLPQPEGKLSDIN